MTSDSSSAVALAFLERWLADRDAGHTATLAEYQRRFAGFEDLIAAEYALLTGSQTAGDGDGPPAAAPPIERIGPYRLLRRLGAGGQGEVYLAEHDELDRRVAVKLLTGLATGSDEAFDRFRREAEAASRIDHPGICTVYERGGRDDAPYIAMAFVPGESLADRLTRESPLDLATALPLFERTAHALDAAHRAGIVHRDIKPGNLMIKPDGDPVLLDFGIARLPERDAAPLTRPGLMLGTPQYCAPEQIEGDELDARTDVYALGVMLFEALSGERPFRAATQQALFRRILDGGAPRPSTLRTGLPPELDVVVATAMHVRKDQRYASAADFAEDLRRVRMREPILARRTSLPRRLWLWTGRNPAWAGSLAAAATLLLAIAVVATVFAVQATSALAEVRLLSDIALFDQLALRNARESYPAVPSRVARMDRWLEDAARMLAREPGYRAELDRLRARARRVPLAERRFDTDLEQHNEVMLLSHVLSGRGALMFADPDGPAAASSSDFRYEFEDEADRRRHEDLSAVLLSMNRLRKPGIVNAFTVAAVRHRRALALQLGERIGAEDAAAWRWCAEALAASSHYEGVGCEPIPGLVPLGIDADSGLVEFWHVASGERPTWRGEPLGRGQVVLDDTGREGIVMVLLPGGRTRLGARANGDAKAPGNVDPDATPLEGPPYEVRLAPFLIGKHEVSVAQWRRIFGSQVNAGPRAPMVEVPWSFAAEACRRWDLALPTEAQWEYACRAGSTTPFATGRSARTLLGFANFCKPGGIGGIGMNDGIVRAAPIGSLRPNAFGLHDMLGNVAEWCVDPMLGYDAPVRDGDGRRGGAGDWSHRVLRPGSFASTPSLLRSAARGSQRPRYSADDLGLRPARAWTSR